MPYGQSFRLIGVLTKFKGSTEVASIVQGSDHLLDYANRVLPDISTDSKILWESDAKLSLRADVCPDKKPDDFLFTHDYANSGAPLFRVIGGSAATGRRLAEKVVAEMAPYASLIGKNWTRTARLPGGDFQAAIGPELLSDLQQKYPFIDTKQTQRLFAAYGTDASAILNGAKSAKALGQDFGNGLFESEVRWLLQREWAKTAEDIIWRRSMLGLEFSQSQIDALNNWIAVNHDS